MATSVCSAVAGEVMGCYVPQAVVKDSTVLDVDLVLSEVVEDGELLLVEYSTGPEAYTTRYTPLLTQGQLVPGKVVL